MKRENPVTGDRSNHLVWTRERDEQGKHETNTLECNVFPALMHLKIVTLCLAPREGYSFLMITEENQKGTS